MYPIVLSDEEEDETIETSGRGVASTTILTEGVLEGTSGSALASPELRAARLRHFAAPGKDE